MARSTRLAARLRPEADPRPRGPHLRVVSGRPEDPGLRPTPPDARAREDLFEDARRERDSVRALISDAIARIRPSRVERPEESGPPTEEP